MLNLTINAAKPVKFNEAAIAKIIDEQGSIIADIKSDGVRCHLVIKPTADVHGQPAARCYALSRTNKALPALRELFQSDADKVKLGQFLSESLYPEGIILDGEMMVKGVDFQTGSGYLRRKAPIEVGRLEYILYGVMPLVDIMEDSKRPLTVSNCVMQAQLGVVIHQVKELLPALSWNLVTSYEVYSMEELHELYGTVREAGHEGLVVKAPFGKWHRGKKVGWWKLKNEDTIDGHVVGLMWGTVGKQYEGKVIGFEVELEDNGHVVRCEGLTDALIEAYTMQYTEHNRYKRLAEHTNPFDRYAIQVKFMERTPDGSLRHPKFDCWRGTESDPTVKA